MSNILLEEGLSFDDVLLVPGYSAILPDECQTSTKLTKELNLNIPIVSAAMDTVTEALTAISMARAGGLGFIHRNLSIEDQSIEVDRVKKSESGMIVDPITVEPDVPIADVLKIMAKYRISGIPVTKDDKLVGIVTNRDLRFETNLSKSTKEVMTSENLITVPEKCTLEESKIMLHKHRIEKLLVVDSNGKLKGFKLRTAPQLIKAVLILFRKRGINPGKDFENWITGILNKHDITNTQELLDLREKLPEGIRFRESQDKFEAKPRLIIVTSDLTTQSKVHFPEMADLYWKNPGEEHPAKYVRASMSIPLFFDPFEITDI